MTRFEVLEPWRELIEDRVVCDDYTPGMLPGLVSAVDELMEEELCRGTRFEAYAGRGYMLLERTERPVPSERSGPVGLM